MGTCLTGGSPNRCEKIDLDFPITVHEIVDQSSNLTLLKLSSTFPSLAEYDNVNMTSFKVPYRNKDGRRKSVKAEELLSQSYACRFYIVNVYGPHDCEVC